MSVQSWAEGDRGRGGAGPLSLEWGAGRQDFCERMLGPGAQAVQCSERGAGWGTDLRSQRQRAPMGNMGKKTPEVQKVSWALGPSWVQILTLLLNELCDLKPVT